MADASVTLEETFALFDTGGAGSFPSADLGQALRSLGKRLTEDSVASLKGQADTKGGKVSLDDFKDFVLQANEQQKTVEEIKGAFAIFEKESEMKSHGEPGTVDKRVLKHALCSLGDKLSKEDTETFLEACGSGQAISMDTLLQVVAQHEVGA